MANVSVQASFLLNTGEVVDMKTTMTEGTATELQTSTDYSVSAVSIGTYGEGKVLTQILQPPQAPNASIEQVGGAIFPDTGTIGDQMDLTQIIQAYSSVHSRQLQTLY